MNLVGAYQDYQKNAERMEFLCFNIKSNDVVANPLASETKAVKEDKNVQNNFQNADGIDMQDVSWGRVTRKENASSMSNKPFMCAFIEKPTSVELFEKDRTMDKRNVEERAFSTGGKVIDFTV